MKQNTKGMMDMQKQVKVFRQATIYGGLRRRLEHHFVQGSAAAALFENALMPTLNTIQRLEEMPPHIPQGDLERKIQAALEELESDI